MIAGCLGSRLPAGEVELCALAPGATLEAVHRDGLRLESDGARVGVALPMAGDPAELGVQDLVVVAVKATSPAPTAKTATPASAWPAA